MTKIILWIDRKHNKGLHELMTNQIYTAVLGSIIYMLFDWGYTIFTNGYYSRDICIRTFYLFVGIAFYLSDYYYIKGSNPYRKWHFLFDLIFMICMLYSTKLLNVDIKDPKISDLPPINLDGIRNSYLIFLMLYLIWDVRELIAVYSKHRDQRAYYYEVVIWETISILSLIFIRIHDQDSGLLLLLMLAISTFWFCTISIRKPNHMSFRKWLKELAIKQ